MSTENYVSKAEEKLLELQKIKEESDKKFLSIEIVIGLLSVAIMLSLTFIASFLEMEDWLRIVIIVFAFVTSFAGLFFALRIEQVAGYYMCQKCEHKYIPTYNQVLWAMHMGRTRYMKCPHCNKWSWNKKVIK